MNTHADKTKENISQSVPNAASHKQSNGDYTFQFVDNRPEAIVQRKLQEAINSSPKVKQLKAHQEMANNSSQVYQAAQFKAIMDNHSAQQQQPIQKNENNTGLPDNLKSRIEHLSGYSMDDVKVHYNSNKPTQLQAHAYAQGTDIHLASGQERHLPHEAWHVVQQKQGRVKPTIQVKGGVNINDDAGLEKEADVMGVKAQSRFDSSSRVHISEPEKGTLPSVPVQLKRYSALPDNPYSGEFNVDIGMGEINMAGKLTKKDDNSDVDVKGSVMVEEYSFPAERNRMPVKSSKTQTATNALRVHNLNADPRKVGLGQVLTYQHGLLAINKDLEYVIAMNVTGARGPFYEKMGFTDYNPNPEEGYRALEKQKTGIDEFLRKPNIEDLTDKDQFDEFVRQKNSLTEKMAESPMVIKAKTLIVNSENVWKNFWKEED